MPQNNIIHWFLTCCIVVTILSANAQSDTLQLNKEDSVLVETHSPTKAVIMSAILPGLGQIYNKKYWKLPIIYAAMGAGIYFIGYNTQQYNLYKEAYLNKIDDDPSTVDEFPGVPADGLRNYLEEFQKWREISYMATGVIYLLNLIDASVDAHLYYFDVSDDLSMQIRPRLLPASSSAIAPGITLSFKL